jgi:predicted nucleic acid-binding Zn ribbon protein
LNRQGSEMAKCDWCKVKDVPADRVRFCSEECSYEDRKDRTSRKNQDGKSCEICGSPLSKAGKKLCGSEECKKEKDRRRKRLSPDGTKMVRPKKEKVVRTCENCNGPLPKFAKKFCNDECRLERDRKDRKADREALACPICGDPLGPMRKKFCSEKCNLEDISRRNAKLTEDDYHSNCQQCGDPIAPPKLKFCSDGCKTKHLNTQKREKRLDEKGRYCEDCGEELPLGKSRFCKQECRRRWHNRKTNENGRVNMKTGYLWYTLAEAIRERDNHECQYCGTTKTRGTRRHDVHHIKPRKSFDDVNLANYPHNLVTLCESCHKGVEFGTKTCPEPSTVVTPRIAMIMRDIYEYIDNGNRQV